MIKSPSYTNKHIYNLYLNSTQRDYLLSTFLFEDFMLYGQILLNLIKRIIIKSFGYLIEFEVY